jgi:hypothetical protein
LKEIAILQTRVQQAPGSSEGPHQLDWGMKNRLRGVFDPRSGRMACSRSTTATWGRPPGSNASTFDRPVAFSTPVLHADPSASFRRKRESRSCCERAAGRGPREDLSDE